MTKSALRGFVANECAQSDARADALRVHENATVIEARLPRRCTVATHERDQHLGQPPPTRDVAPAAPFSDLTAVRGAMRRPDACMMRPAIFARRDHRDDLLLPRQGGRSPVVPYSEAISARGAE